MRHLCVGLACCFVLNSGNLFAHKEPVHQHITREAFKLLLKSYPQLASSEMATFVGYSETNANSQWQSWGDGKLVSGAWLEDQWDIVYHYGIGRVPNFNQWSANAYADLFPNKNRDAFSSITHFWNADGGLNAPTDLSDIAYVGFPLYGQYWSFSIPENAMQKMYKYLNGDFDNRWIYKTTTYWNCAPFCYLGSDQRMGNLFQLYRQALQVYAVAYLDCFSGYWTEAYNQCPTIYYNIKYVYEQLGRMSHLLEDQSVPAHVHSNAHACRSGMYCDYYENNAPSYHLWTADEVYANGGTFINPYNTWSDPLYYLMYLVNQATDHYASGRSDGDDNFDASCPGLSQIVSTLGLPITQSQVNDANCRAMHDKLFPLVIRATAGLLYWFAVETGQLPMVVTVSGTFTVESGQQLRIPPNSVFYFTPGSRMVVNGTLIANGNSSYRITFTRSGNGDWQGIEFNGSSNSSLQYCDITYAISPIVATNTSNLTISSVTIGNSNFQNYPHDAAMAFYNSSPTISSVIINGQSNSWNGIRLAQGSTGSIQYNTIQNCGAGNGIVVQGNSSPQIWGNIIRNNYFHGIIVVSNGTGNPILYGNTLESNGIVGGSKIYNGINFYSSSGRLEQNTVQSSNYGIYFDTYASGIAGWQYQGNNRVTGNNYGLVAYNSSSASFGTHFPPSTFFNACNKLYGNITYNAVANTNSQIDAQAAWWGSSPPDPSKIVAVNNSYVNYGYWRPYDEIDCTVGGGGALSLGGNSNGSGIAESGNPDLLSQALRARLKGEYALAVNLYKTVLNQSSIQAERQQGLVGIFNVFRDSRNAAFLAEVSPYQKENGPLGDVASELLVIGNIALGNIVEGKALAQALGRARPGTEAEKRALVQLVSLSGFAESERANASQAGDELVRKFGATLDKGLLAALIPSSKQPRGQNGFSSTAIGEDGIALLNYPNPFNPSTRFEYRVVTEGLVSLRIYDVLGREVATLVNEQKQPGVYNVNWDASGNPSGIYFSRLESGANVRVQKVILMR